MKHKEWLGKTKLVKELLEKAGLVDCKGKQKMAMRCIILSKYLEFMTVEETIARLQIEYEVEVSVTTYYRLFNQALSLMEENQ